MGSSSKIKMFLNSSCAVPCALVLCCAALCHAAAVEARSMEQAIDALQSLGVSTESPAADKHPEKYVQTGGCSH